MRDFQVPGRSASYAENGMCATSHPLAAKVALDMLQAGGSAVDAAIAGAVLLGICEPQMTGIGGDCFVLLKPAGSEEVIGLNGSGRAPLGLNAETLRAKGLKSMPIHGIDTVTMPGAIDAFCTLHAAHGRLPLDQVLAPAIHYAEAGVPVAPRVAADWAEGPVNWVSFWDAARFVNWLHNGQPTGAQGLGTTEDGAYLNVGNQATFARQPLRQYAPRAAAALDYESLCCELLADWGECRG